MAEIFVATETFHTNLSDGTPVTVRKDVTHVLGGSELHVTYPQHFVAAESRVSPGVEAATAVPGEPRPTTRKKPVKE